MWLIALAALLAIGCASRYSHSRTKLKRLITASLAICCVFTLLFVYMGFATKYWLFENHNNCSMTYNNPNYAVKEPVLSKSPKSRSSFSSFRGLLRNDNDYVLSIYEVPTASKVFSKKHVDPSTTPLLYVHGFMGNSNQARSISSDMLLASNVRDNTDFHYFINSHLPKTIDRNFTFFTVDFGDSLVALSTDETISRSIFLNECIQRIQDMYKEADKKVEKEKMASKASTSTSTSSSASSATPNSNSNSQAGSSKSHPLVIVAHSLGGIVARLSFLLSNFPSQKLKCSNTVSDLIMLSSPNVAPPNNYDMNMETLFSKVNSAWRGSFHKDCSNSSKYDVLGNSKGSSSSNGNFARGLNENTISVNWNCPPCTAQVRVVSITGGIFDDLVDPDLTLLSHMTPAMVNRTYRPKAVNSSNIPTPQRSFFARTVGWMYDLVMMPFRFVFSIIFELFTFCNWVFSCCYAIYAFFVPASVASSNNSTIGIYVNESECAAFNTSDSNVTVPFQCLTNSNLSSFGNDSRNISVNELMDEKQPVCIRKFECDNTTRTRYLDMLYHLSNIDMEELHDTMQPYKEPLHLNIRTSSIFIDKSSAGVKDLLVVDHNAVVWCQELLRYILNGLSVLKVELKAKNSNKFIFDHYATNNNSDSKNELEAFWSAAFPIKFIDPPLDFNFLSSYNCSSSSSSCDQSSQVVGGAILYNHVHISNFSHPVANFLYRNESDSQWAKMAYVEKSQLFDLLHNSSSVYGLGFLSSIFKYTSFMFVSGKAISMILFWYVFISVGVVNYFQFDIFVGNRSSKCPLRVEDFSLPLDDETDVSGYFLSSIVFKEMLNLSKFHVLVHSNLKVGLNIVVNAMEEMKRVKNGASIVSRLMNIFSGISIIMILVGFYNYYYYFIDGFLPAISVFACSVSSYFIALVLRSVLHILTGIVKLLFTVVTDVLRVVSMKLFKSGTYLGNVSLFEIFFGTSKFRNCLFVLSYLALFMFYTSSFTQMGSHLSDGLFYQYMILFTLYLLLAVLIAYFLFAPVLVSRNCLCKDFYVNSLGKSFYMTDIGLLYLPFLLLLMPTFKLVTGSLFLDMKTHYDDVDILDVFGPNNLSMIFLLCIVCLHLIAVVFAKSVLSFVIKPANYVQLFFLSDSKNNNDVLFLKKLDEMVNDSEEISQIIENKRERESKIQSEKSNDNDTKKYEVSAAASTAVVTTLALSCIHENGGKKAVFVRVSKNEVPENALQSLGKQKYCQEVVLGPTYKVYYCNCASVVPKIEHARDFCEWCRCTQCGGRSGGYGLKPGPSVNDGRFKVYLQEEARKRGGKTQDYDDDDDNNSNGNGKTSSENSSPFVNFIFDFIIANSSPITYLLCSYWGTQDSLYRFCYVLTVLSSFQLLRMLFVKQKAITDADLGLKK